MTEPAFSVLLQTIEPALLSAMPWAIIVAAAAIVIQTFLLLAMFLATRSVKKQVTTLAGKMEPLSETALHTLKTANATLAEVRGYALEYSTKGNEILDLTRTQLGRIDELMVEATARTRAQMDRVEMVIDDTVNRFQETTSLLQNGVVRPLRQVAGITAGVRTILGAVFGARRTTVERATHDEEMFI